MLYRFKRHPLVVAFCLIQLILFSAYTYLFYQTSSTSENPNGNPWGVSVSPMDLPSSHIEQEDRPQLKKNYKALRLISSSSSEKRLPSVDEIKALNVSFVGEPHSNNTLIQCPVLPSNLGKHRFE